MGLPVTTGCQAMCSFGLAPSALVGTSAPTTMIANRPAMTIMDHAPMVNIPPFGMCSSLANPMVAAATAAALGVLTPMPCVPAIPAPWVPGSPTTILGNFPALTMTSKCICAYGGVIQIITPATPTVLVAG